MLETRVSIVGVRLKQRSDLFFTKLTFRLSFVNGSIALEQIFVFKFMQEDRKQIVPIPLFQLKLVTYFISLFYILNLF